MLAGFALLLSGCATTIQTEVTTFHEWPSYAQDKSYVFERSKEQQNNLEYLNYENLVRTELQRLGFMEAQSLQSARLKAMIGYSITARDVHLAYPVIVDPYWGGAPYPYWYGPAWRGMYSPFYGPFYDPFWFGPPIVERREENFLLYTRRFRFLLERTADGKMVYDTRVVSEGRNGSLAAIMPYLVRAAFSDFPGKSGVPRQVELKMK
jgi:hypothetical protein